MAEPTAEQLAAKLGERQRRTTERRAVNRAAFDRLIDDTRWDKSRNGFSGVQTVIEKLTVFELWDLTRAFGRAFLGDEQSDG